MSILYQRQQKTPWRYAWLLALLIFILLMGVLVFTQPANTPRWVFSRVIGPLFLVSMILLSVYRPTSITMVATQKGQEIKLGIGAYTYFIPWNEIRTVERTCVPWWILRGMQWVPFWGIAWTASYGEAIRLHRKDASPILISTDDLAGLLAVISSHLPQSPSTS